MKRFLAIPLFLAMAFSAQAFQQTPKVPKDEPKVDAPPLKRAYQRGRVNPSPEKLAKLRAAGLARHDHVMKRIPHATAPKYDCRDLGIVPPIVDQSQCGSCWDFSGCSICTSALIKAGYGKADGSFRLSEQYVLDCGSNGGCGGDDNTTVTSMCHSKGLPLASDYGPYTAQAGRCKGAGLKLYKIADTGFCDQTSSGVSSTQSIKDAMVQWGPIGCAIAADDSFMNNPAGTVFDTTTSTGIDHDVVLVGWDDSKGKHGAWLLRNSWGVNWCDKGYCWIGYSVNRVGTEAIWATASPLPAPPTPPVPVPPSPTPTPQPAPGVPAITSALTVSAVTGEAFTYQVTATNSPLVFSAIGLPAGLTSTLDGHIAGTPTEAKTSTVTLIVANASGASTALLTLAVKAPGPVSISITLTAEQIQNILDQSGTVNVSPTMTVAELIKVFEQKKACGNCSKLPVGPVKVDEKPAEKPDRSAEYEAKMDRLDAILKTFDRIKAQMKKKKATTRTRRKVS